MRFHHTVFSTEASEGCLIEVSHKLLMTELSGLKWTDLIFIFLAKSHNVN